MSALSQAIKDTTKGFLKSYVDASLAKNPQLLSDYLSQDCVRFIGPQSYLQSVGAPADFSMNNTEYESHFGKMEFYTFHTHEIHDLTIDTENLKAAARSDLTGTFIDGKKLSRTFVWFLDFNDDGTKIIKTYQHNDSEEGRNFQATIRTYKEAKNQAEVV
ncbi:hypothetical protein G7Z17_g8532 [Cylindrodendrum hubeiense]|uniref:SnoaL-like domain-containing protein n=1 Tax=Cylindrodendrum hubeiense TaxID=595255 RepID=A0A9P5H125_9HYPO|nr:hypothetical protein G7Z17_g8532 [Cylindrodendrum hubeiense]